MDYRYMYVGASTSGQNSPKDAGGGMRQVEVLCAAAHVAIRDTLRMTTERLELWQCHVLHYQISDTDVQYALACFKKAVEELLMGSTEFEHLADTTTKNSYGH
ncbi:uncharacterized protein LOC8056404 [Sorghum bicolor]|uniref:uncharacterized protein LOC8056404 n=1 Tax=Sorghum bicolor TaxID=4558 RepID=UPI000B42530A|nr:uncharacterized protein LOC8056404 [Sorghum bicolor]|eukprot:XP_002454727.2 uncharacterized protein LOC8056404 [Sorghum bicolor]